MQRLTLTVENLSNKGWLHVVVILLFCYVTFTLPLQILGLPSGFDMVTNIRFAVAFQEAISAGQMFPSWANDNFGYGSIGIRFYPPVSAYILALTHFVTNDWFAAFLANLYLWMAAGCFGVYLFVKEWGTRVQGLLGAILYAVVPQHLAEIFQFFMFAEFAAWGVLPFCFLFVTRICRGGTWKDVALFAASYSVLILTHLPTTIIVSFCLPLYVLCVLDWKNYKRIFAHLVSAIALTLLATSFRWVMLVNELNWIAHNGPEHYGSGHYDFSLWLFPNVLATRTLFIYVLTSWLFDIAIVLTAALAVPALIYLRRGSSETNSSVRKIIIASLITTFFALFMLSRPSFYVWDSITLLQKIQFPWRWLSVMSMFSVLLFALSVPPLMSKFRRFSRLVAYPALALVVAIVLFDITQIIIPSAPLPSAKMAKIAQTLKEDPIWKGWWPTWAREKAFDNSERVLAGSRSVEVTNWDLESKEFIVQAGDPINVRVKNFYYPHWKATVNGLAAEISHDQNGAIIVPVSNEVSNVRLSFEEPVINNIAHVISSVTWLLPVFLIPFYYLRKHLPRFSGKRLFNDEFDYP